MSPSGDYADFVRHVEEQFGIRRSLLFMVGSFCVVLGIMAVGMPLELFEGMIRLMGTLLVFSGAIKGAQMIGGLTSFEARRRGWPLITVQVLLDFSLGFVLFTYWQTSIEVTTYGFGLIFIAEGFLLGYIALRAPKQETGWAIGGCGTITALMGFAIIVGWVSNPMASAGLLVGLKLIVFGSALIWIAFRAFRGEHALIYEPAHITPEVGELYAVYFGTAFHLGVYIGNGEVVHYLDDGLVHRATWEEFCEGREPRHWSYPDLNYVPPETVVATALSEVGKTYPYSLVKFNCEHFAIFCKTGGRTTHSRFAQVVVGVNDVIENPFLGTIAELNTRFVEWLAFHFGGPPGKRLSLVIRRVGAVVTNFLLLTRLRS